jgi:hypothetical protein
LSGEVGLGTSTPVWADAASGGPRRAASFEGEPVRKWGRKRRMEGGGVGRSAGGRMWAGEGGAALGASPARRDVASMEGRGRMRN